MCCRCFAVASSCCRVLHSLTARAPPLPLAPAPLPHLSKALHPASMSWDKRLRCLEDLRAVGFQVGTGAMVGLPGQTLCDVAGDVAFFKQLGANMVGLGPYITEPGTPVAAMWAALHGHIDKKAHMARAAVGGGGGGCWSCVFRAVCVLSWGTERPQPALDSPPLPSSSCPHSTSTPTKQKVAMFHLTTRANALARITLGGANITATTALQAIDPNGREVALRRGANVLMPILTPTAYRENYQLYEGKPCITDTADECRK